MPNDQSGEVLLLALAFAAVTTSKLCPVLVLLDAGDEDIVVARVTSQTTRTVFDVEIVQWEQAGLLRSSVVRLHKVNTIETGLVNRRLGILTASDWTQVRERTQQIWYSL